ncbi:hypothetical protein MMC10_008129 [Thelotrema lepadinum]|nr:hypothetical protein [Thelotrema lepadinum]
MKLYYVTLDVFTKSRYSGNPLAIIRVPAAFRDDLSEEQKQKMATEFNLSETVFLHEAKSTDWIVDYDIFGARTRIPFAGHPTIGTAVYLSNHAPADYPAITCLRTPLAGEVPFDYQAQTGLATVSVPHNLHVHKKRLPHPWLEPDDNPSDVDTVPQVSIVKGMTFILVPLSTVKALGSVSSGLFPASDVYKGLHLDVGWDTGFTGTFYYCDVTALADKAARDAFRRVIRTRCIGRIEDPGTGSASSALCCYLALQEPQSAGPLFNYQLIQGVEMGRRCDIYVNVTRSQDGRAIEKVELIGNATAPVMEGTIEV